MFRRLSHTLPKDPQFPADLEQLGYGINEKDQIRSLVDKDQEFNFFISKNERVREVQREAMDSLFPLFDCLNLTNAKAACVRNNLAPRFAALGLETVRLPLCAGPKDPHIPILVSSNISHAKRLIMYFGENIQDLGILAYRTIGQESLSSGSVVELVTTIKNGSHGEDTAIVIANVGQLIWYRRGARAVTRATWNALPRKLGTDGQMKLDPVKNRVPGHETPEDHVRSVFEMVTQKAKADVTINVVGLGDGAREAIKYLDEDWTRWKESVQAIAVGLSYFWRPENDEFAMFWSKRARVYFTHSEPLDTPLNGRDDTGCNCYSGGETQHLECLMPRAYQSILSFFQLVNDVPGYEEPAQEDVVDEEDNSNVVQWAGNEGGLAEGAITFSTPNLEFGKVETM